MMKLTASQIQRLSEKILKEWKSQNLITLKVEESKVLQAMKDAINIELQAEIALEKDVHALMDNMEREGQEFQRGKMFNLLKNKLAKEKKVIL